MKALEKKRLNYFKIITEMLVLLILTQQSFAADPGHAAPAIGSGMFESGNYTFPDSLEILKILNVSDGLLYVDPTTSNVGIGTTAPDALLNVNGIVKINNGGALDIYNAGTADANYERLRIFPSGGVFYFQEGHTGSGSSRPFQFQVNAIDVMRIDTAGSVGIGTTEPGDAKLNVTGTVDAWQVTVNGTAVGTGGGGDDLTNVAFTNQTNTFVAGQIIDNTSAVTDAYFNISDGAAPKLIVDSAGNVGIGTAAPSAKLDIQAGSGNDILYAGNSNGVFRIYNDGTFVLARVSGATSFAFGQWTTVSAGSAAFYSSNTDFTGDINIYSGKILKLFAGVGTGQTGVWDASTGNVGIGTTAPTHLLNVAGNANITGDLEIEGGELTIATNQNLSVDGGTLFIDDNLNYVGIGTTAPSSKLTVAGDIALTNTVSQIISDSADGSDSKYLGISATGAIGAVRGSYIELRGNEYGNNKGMLRLAAGQAGTTGTEGFIIFDTGIVTQMVIDRTGNVGIGTIAPGTIGTNTAVSGPVLNVYAAGSGKIYTRGSSSGEVGFEDTGAGVGDKVARWIYDGGKLSFERINDAFSSVGSTPMVVDSLGNVGIGTTTPGAKLEIDESVAGNFPVLRVNNIGNGGETGIRFRTKDASANDAHADISWVASGAEAGALTFRVPYSTPVMTIKSGGNVGIGTTGPSTPLDVQGIITTRSASPDNPAAPTEGLRMAYVSSGADTTVYRNSIFNEVSASANTGLMQFRVNNGASTQATVMSLSGSGNVGIGTTAPTHGLNVFAASPLNVTRSGGTAGIEVDSTGNVYIRLG